MKKSDVRHILALCLLAALSVRSAGAATWYVTTNGTDSAAGTNWATAKQTIQAAIDLTVSNDTVLVSNGVYATGTRVTPGYSTSNRVIITKNITVQSVNGPALTMIKGTFDGSYTLTGCIRCVYMTNGFLTGFTLTNGAAPNVGSNEFNYCGGGAYAPRGTLSNCVITGCSAYYSGGGAYGGTLNNCTLSGNSVDVKNGGGAENATLNTCVLSGNSAGFYGGGADNSMLNRCVLKGNYSAGLGGGSCNSTLDNCLLSGNGAYANGGGSAYSTLNNCTVSGNSAAGQGGSMDCTLNNCIVYFNSAEEDSNYDSLCTVNYSCTTPMPSGGAGNITNDPQFVNAAANDFHLMAFSACIDAGSNSYAQGATDLDGNPRIAHGIVDMGAYEHQGGRTFCVAPNGTDAADGHSWPAAKQSIQAALDATVDGDAVLVSNGVYSTGVRVTPGYSASNRVVITKNILVQSVNGPAVTTIRGLNGGTNASLAANIRCVFITNGVLSGFTLANGGAPNGASTNYDQSGGGAYAQGGTLSNCVITGCGAYGAGGGSEYGTLNNCVLSGNSASGAGGGAINGTLNNCTLWGNSSSSGGGARGGSLNNCIVYSNSASSYSNYYLSFVNYSCTTPMPTNGAGNITNDPQFVNAAASNFHLSATSPCIDAGSNSYAQGSTDLDGNPRIARGIVDMGAYEYQGLLTFCIATNGSNSADGHSWPAAKQTIQAAVDAAVDGDTVLVSNGVYSTGVKVTPGYSTSNRVVITKNILVQSVNGFAVTTIQGLNGGTNTSLAANIRCVFITNGVLSGFTLANGAAPNSGGSDYNQSGGGAYAQGGTLSNCVVTGCGAFGAGGGSIYGTLNNCMLSGDSSVTGGGGAMNSTLNNCTLWGNSSSSGGGARGGSLNNCIVYSNSASSGPNYYSAVLNYSCTTPMPTNGAGNITNDPQFVNAAVSNFHLSATSPCIDAGNNSYAPGLTDLDGNPRIVHGTVDMGVYEVPMVSVTLLANGGTTTGGGTYIPGTNVLVSVAATNGHWFFTQWSDGYTNATRTIAIPLTNVTYTAIFTQLVGALTFHVATDGNDVADGFSWPTAKQTIQGGVNAATDGDTVLVSNGVYATGTRVTPGGTLTNRVVITANILLQSVNGPAATSIQGMYDGQGSSTGNMRCVFMTSGVLAGFTLTNGGTRSGGLTLNCFGGGVYATGGALTNCAITGCHALVGGGSYSGALNNCSLCFNTAASDGGGAYSSTLSNCLISGNSSASYDGGVGYYCTLCNCAIIGNTASNTGGGVGNRCTLYNCTIAGNSAAVSGGGVCFYCTNFNCIIYSNTAPDAPNWFYAYSPSIFSNCCTMPMPTNGTGNITNDPQFVNAAAGDYRLQPFSQCIDAGNNSFAQGTTDLQGHPRIFNGTVDMGAYERIPVWYVATNGSDSAVGTNWSTAKQTIQAAADVAYPYESVLVTNGIYATSVRVTPGYSASNRVVITNNILVQSLNGPAVTSIQGLNGGTNTSLAANIRCVFITNGVLAGFTLTNGAAPSYGSSDYDFSGGGAFLSGASLSNCVIAGCAAYGGGGGAFGGMLVNCTLSDNSVSWYGGGSSDGTLYNCILTGNATLRDGGGAYNSMLYNCMLTGNSAELGGGSHQCTLHNCTLSYNWAVLGGGSFLSSNYNCILYFNTAIFATNYDDLTCVFDHCCASPLPSTGEGNIAVDPQFVNAAAGNFHLKASSPCVNAGNNSYAQGVADLDGNPRIVNAVIDMGAYEYQSSGGYWSWAASITSDLTNLTDCSTSDGYQNLLKYATGSSPTNSDDLADMGCAQPNGVFILNFNRNTNADDVTLIIEESDTATNDATWNGIATNIDGTGWNSTNVIETGTGTPVCVSVSDTAPLSTNCFLRLCVIKP